MFVPLNGGYRTFRECAILNTIEVSILGVKGVKEIIAKHNAELTAGKIYIVDEGNHIA